MYCTDLDLYMSPSKLDAPVILCMTSSLLYQDCTPTVQLEYSSTLNGPQCKTSVPNEKIYYDAHILSAANKASRRFGIERALRPNIHHGQDDYHEHTNRRTQTTFPISSKASLIVHKVDLHSFVHLVHHAGRKIGTNLIASADGDADETPWHWL